MNLILLNPDDFTAPGRVRLDGRRLQHIRDVHSAAPGDSLRVGLVDGPMGSGQLVSLTDTALELEVTLDQIPPPQLPLTLLLALPRPKMLKRIFQTCATFGVQELILFNSYRVEKSYWQSPWLTPERIHEHLLLGLEQGVATQLPRVRLEKRFKPFVEDRLPALVAGKRALLAHPYQASPCPGPQTPAPNTLLVIGPEGGLIGYEVNKLIDAGLQPVHLGPRILRVETALSALLGRLF
ncbi:16S rRNA (uracil(1498)-N(3))-methyltransferase [Motiliproteus sp. SC1-56]|uniref:16S rRNA (uracil(1498)-N(3))-methyltransferase n=1 Tax=Motiliproteus sp. SC1-56 TaxID=2799565 RepID=UPI001A8CFFD1|nr:16S rRNA (uracil(1498)-N(3))-methyltransferase [Motiliproteus sp. SC1-56]